MIRVKTSILISLMFLGVVGCNGSHSVVAPGTEQSPFKTPFDSLSACPPVEEMCEIIAQEVELECPDDGYRNYGQLNSCRKQAVYNHMKNLPDCYSGQQQLDLKKCVLIAVGLAEEGRTTPPAEPRPNLSEQ